MPVLVERAYCICYAGILQIKIFRKMNDNQAGTQVWPPAYTLKKHPRAKRIRFRASLRRGLEVIVPSFFNPKKIPALLDQNRAWLEKQLLELNAQRQPFVDFLPAELDFQALNMNWKIHYLPSETRLQLCSRPQQELVLVGNLQNKAACKKKLLSWIKEFAKEHLLALLQQTSLETGLSYKKGSIRDQLTRWGSCSREKKISLNYKLLFLPPALVRHTLLHELCHTVHFDHSERFWTLLACYDTDWVKNRRAMKKAGRWVPGWLV